MRPLARACGGAAHAAQGTTRLPGLPCVRSAPARRVRSGAAPTAAAARQCDIPPPPHGVARPLLIDNYDSYSYNLYQILAEVYGVPPLVYHNDELDLAQLQQLAADGQFHHIIISPGPGTPSCPDDVGVCLDALAALRHVPILGVCLGHQALAHVAGGNVVRAPEPVHGRLSRLVHSGHRLFSGIPSGAGGDFDVVRYHSLIVDAASLPAGLEAIAWTTGGHQAVQLQGTAGSSAAAASSSASTGEQQQLIMALAARDRPHYGVQFHPESIATRYGVRLLANFRDLAYQHCQQQLPRELAAVACLGSPGGGFAARTDWPPVAGMLQLQHQRQPLPRHADTQQQHQHQHQHQHQQQQRQPLGPHADKQQQLQRQQERQQQQQQQQRERPPPPPPQQASTASTSSLWDPEAASYHDDWQGVVGSAWGEEGGTDAGADAPPADAVARLRLCWRRLPGVLDAAGGSQALFEALVGPGEDSWWLDSASTERAQFSFMGGGTSMRGPLWCRVSYELPAAQASSSSSSSGGDEQQWHHQQQHQQHRQRRRHGTLTITRADGSSSTHRGASVWAYLQQQLRRLQLDSSALLAASALPFNFWGGFVGALGYELRSEAGGGSSTHAAPTPDAAFFFADRLLAADHQTGDVYVLALAGAHEHSSSSSSSSGSGIEAAVADADAWLAQAADAVQQLAAGGDARQRLQRERLRVADTAAAAPADAAAVPGGADASSFTLAHDRRAYVDNVAACQAALVAGDSYELCLTTSLRMRRAAVCPWRFYTTLRQLNPAPYAAWLAFGPSSGCWQQQQQQQQHQHQHQLAGGRGAASACGRGSMTVCCASPERFLRGERGGVLEAKPIKGTARRAPGDTAADAALAHALLCSEKDRAENLMIVDLLRNDLGRVCEVGSVHVPGLMQVESFASVHQLVSTVRGLRRPGVSCVEAVRAAFPGGSMTGAPKLRSMEILDQLEGAARGVYSGAIGYFSVNDTFDLNIVIRSAVYARGEVAIGAGGAITVQSDAGDEFEEMRLKAAALVRAMDVAAALQGQHERQPMVAV